MNNEVDELDTVQEEDQEGISDEVKKVLDQFLIRFTGFTHPLDEERWADFVVAAHRANEDIAEVQLEEALGSRPPSEEWKEGWVEKYRWGRILLARNDQL